MKFQRLLPVLALVIVSSLAARAHAQADPQAMAAQKEAMKALAMMDGVWRGPASTVLPSGEKHNITQTERIGPFLDGAVKMIEGRGYAEDGSVSFNALGIVSFDAAKKAYSMRSYAMGRAGDFVLTPIADGYAWEIPMGPITVRYTATIKNGEWHEVGDRIAKGQEPVRFFEMTLKRVGDTDWPTGTPVPAK
ncbi:MAG TPA: DUF1579 domain-containing protein [Candidatus Krumholzibacteria bacterium]